MDQTPRLQPEDSPTFRAKSPEIRQLINHALFVLDQFGIPMDQTSRRLERMAMAFLAIGDVKTMVDISNAKSCEGHNFSLKTREIIEFINQAFGESINSGSYDNIRRIDLKLLLAAGIVEKSAPKTATNNPARGYGLPPFFAELFRTSLEPNWIEKCAAALADFPALREQLARNRDLQQIEVLLPEGIELHFSPGKHNVLQKAIIESFLPRFGEGSQVLYVGDTADKFLLLNQAALTNLQFVELAHDELPDIIAFSASKNWIYLIEAVHSSGPIDEIRLLRLQSLTKSCTAEIIFVTAFLDRTTFRKFAPDIAWETEVWIAASPDHLIHFNGHKFLGPY
ncbi:MAG: BsuBI/PstI family type II restriction endonuclease [Bacteroidota bacterium]